MNFSPCAPLNRAFRLSGRHHPLLAESRRPLASMLQPAVTPGASNERRLCACWGGLTPRAGLRVARGTTPVPLCGTSSS